MVEISHGNYLVGNSIHICQISAEGCRIRKIIVHQISDIAVTVSGDSSNERVGDIVHYTSFSCQRDTPGGDPFPFFVPVK